LIKLESVLSRLRVPEETFIHGEYKPNQLLLEAGRVMLVDLDRACTGDPALDVGNFVATLKKEWLLEGHSHLLGLDTIFLEHYLSQSRSKGLAERATAVQVISLLRMLTRYFERLPQQHMRMGNDWPPLALMREAERLLHTLA
jgi:thiamine kinase-like enzyme